MIRKIGRFLLIILVLVIGVTHDWFHGILRKEHFRIFWRKSWPYINTGKFGV